MPVDIQWRLLGPPVDVADRFQRGVEKGQELRLAGERRNALAAFSANPSSPAAANALISVDPTLGFKAREFQRTEADASRQATYRQGASDFLLSQTPGAAIASALTAPTLGGGSSVDPSAPGATANALSGVSPMPVVSLGSQSASSGVNANYGDPRADAFRRMAAADPEKALKLQTDQAKLSKEQLSQYQDLNSASLRLLASVHDQPSYEAALDRARSMYGRFGQNLDDLHLPDQYDPATVQGLMLQTLETDKLLAAQRAEKRLEWDITDDQADNARADRNTDSMIGARGASTAQGWERVGISREGMTLADQRGRRGQDIASADRRRGQDMSSADRVRGQDLTATTRRSGRRGGAQAGSPAPRIATNPKTGERIMWNGSAWVSAK